MKLRAREFTWTFPGPALVMGILNVTPDSFSDGGRFYAANDAIRHGVFLAEQGADIIDVGGESSRPGAEPVSAEEELRRVTPVLRELTRLRIAVSIDTQKPAVAAAALEAGASLINDVGANRESSEMWELVAVSGAAYVAMHMQGKPQTMQANPFYERVVDTVEAYFQERLNRLADTGVRREQILLDPGIGFGKSVVHNLELIAALSRFKIFGRPLVLGVSRKSFLGKVLGLEIEARLPAALACACWARQAGIQIIRTHDVSETRQALKMIDAITSQVPANDAASDSGPTRSQESHPSPGPASGGSAHERRS